MRIAALGSIVLVLAALSASAQGSGSSPGFSIFQIGIDGKGRHALLRKMGGYGYDYPFDISPDAKRMLFVRGGGFPIELFIARIDGTHARLLASNDAIVTPAFSPNGRKVAFEGAFSCSEPGVCYNADIWVVNADGTRLRRISEFATAPSWSTDSTKLAWVGDFSLTTQQGVVTVGNVSGEPRQRVLSPVEGGDVWNIAWSPRGNRLAYTTKDRPEIHIARVSGGSLPHVRTPFSGSAPSWSPDGSRLAFTKWRGNAVYVARADGRSRRRLATGFGPLWSPDGRWIAFQRGDRCRQLLVVRPTGRGERGVTREPCGAYYTKVVWSPDSKRLTFLVAR